MPTIHGVLCGFLKSSKLVYLAYIWHTMAFYGQFRSQNACVYEENLQVLETYC